MPDIYLSSGKLRWPFSKGLVTESLLNAGLEEDDAQAVAQSVETHLLELQQFELSTLDLKKLVAHYAQKVAGTELGQRFEEQTPTFDTIMVLDQTSRVPFSRGILARSFERVGLAPRAAYSMALEVDRTLHLNGVQELNLQKLEQVAAHTLERLEGNVTRDLYLNRYRTLGDIEVLEDGTDVSFPFSKGILAQTLLAAGIEASYAQRIAREVEQTLREEGLDEVSRSSLRERTETLVRRDLGDDLADRYRILRSLRHPNKPIIILIGGVTGTGKSLLASEIAYRLGITRIVSSDSVREVMRAMVSRELLPTLHASTFTAWQAILPPGVSRENAPSARNLLQGFREQVQQVSVGLSAVVRRSIEEHSSVILEGVHVVPEYLGEYASKDATLVPMLVAVPDEDEHRGHFKMRDLETQQHRPVERYLRYFSQIRQIQDSLLEGARRENIPILDGLSVERAAEQAVEVITRRVLRGGSS
jgi:2-phosphoglycerate kinase